MSDILMFTLWIRNDATGESTQIKGQGNSVPEAMKDGWGNACEDFGKNQSGGPPTARAHLAVKLRDGRTVFRRPANFESGRAYDEEEGHEFEAPIAEGDAAKPYGELVKEGRAQWAPPRPKKGTS